MVYRHCDDCDEAMIGVNNEEPETMPARRICFHCGGLNMGLWNKDEVSARQHQLDEMYGYTYDQWLFNSKGGRESLEAIIEQKKNHAHLATDVA